jgi:putative RNA 2'-phosphotransferase
LAVGKENILYLVTNSQKARLEIKGTRIRALYGHTVWIRKKTPFDPHGVLYHGTSKYNYDAIITMGLRKMKRRYVHLSSDVYTAIEVGKRRDESSIVFSANSKQSYLDGISFFVGSQTVWLSEIIEPVYLKIEIGLNMWQK